MSSPHPLYIVHSQATHPASSQGAKGRERGESEAEESDAAIARRHREDLRGKRDPEAERAGEPAAAGVTDRRRRQSGPDGRDDAAGDGQHGQRGERHGLGHEEHGPR